MSQPQGFRTPNGKELTAALVEKVDQQRRLNAEILELLGTMDREHVASDAGYPSLAAYVVHATRMSRPNATRLVAQAKQIAETLTPTGHVTPAVLPHVRDAVLDGAIDGEHIDAIVHTMNALPESTPAEVRQIVETTRHGPHIGSVGGAPPRSGPAPAHRPRRPRTRRHPARGAQRAVPAAHQ